MDELLTMPQVAQWLNLPVATLRWFRHRGEGPPSFRIGRRVMYRRADVAAWIDEQAAADRRGAR